MHDDPETELTSPPASADSAASASASASGSWSRTTDSPPVVHRVGGKANVSAACAPCKRAHLACDVGRPCKRCVNLGREAYCEDVPAKKRGRPKVPKPPPGDPYARGRPYPAEYPHPPGGGGHGRRRPSSSDQAYYSASNNDFDYPFQPPPPIGYNPYPAPSPVKEIFELFATTDFQVQRATAQCFPLTGFHPHEFVNSTLTNFIHPEDRELLEMVRRRLLGIPHGSGSLQSDRDVRSAMISLEDRELLSPAEGMRDHYANQNVRVMRNDTSFDWFNVRLHLGGGLGACLYRPETFGRVYLVVSFLLLRPPAEMMGEDFLRRPIPPSIMGPPTPVTPTGSTPLHHSGGLPNSLPSFSTFAAVAEGAGPSQLRDSPATATQAPPQHPQGYQSYARPPPPSGSSTPTYGAPPPPPPPREFVHDRHAASPVLQRPPPPTSSSSAQQVHNTAYEYPQSHYPDDREAYRRAGGGEDRWRPRPPPYVTEPRSSPQSSSLPSPHPQGQGDGPSERQGQGDYSRRAWEL